MKENKKLLTTLTDGFNGILALVIYNFLLFLSKHSIKIIEPIREKTGYFYINSFAYFEIYGINLIISIFFLFMFAFLLGIFVGKLVRITKKEKI